jgi:hypothetical protein
MCEEQVELYEEVLSKEAELCNKVLSKEAELCEEVLSKEAELCEEVLSKESELCEEVLSKEAELRLKLDELAGMEEEYASSRAQGVATAELAVAYAVCMEEIHCLVQEASVYWLCQLFFRNVPC